MTTKIHLLAKAPKRERGVTLLVAIVLLLILTLFGVFAMNVGVFEQRTSGNDFRAKVVQQIAEAALNHGAESMRMVDRRYRPEAQQPVNPGFWTLCAATETEFPCGAEANPTRRAQMYKFGAGIDLNGNGSVSNFERSSVPLPKITGNTSRFLGNQIPASGGGNFDIEYAVGVLMCRVDVTSNPAAGGTGCTTNVGNTSETAVYTLVSRAEIVGENSRSTIVQSVSASPSVSIAPNAPPIVASGILRGLGSSTVVGNPNGGCTPDNLDCGLPLSIWTKEDLDSSRGSWQTCHFDDYARSSPTVVFGAENVDGEDVPGITVCDGNGSACGCPSGQQLSGGGLTIAEGVDVLDNDNNLPGSYNQVANGTLLDTGTNFPCDLFEFVFGTVKARNDTNGNGTCDTGIDSDSDGEIDSVYDFLSSNSAVERVATCAEVDTKLDRNSGRGEKFIYWVEEDGCSLPGHDVGSPAFPVIIVMDGRFDTTQGMRIFGMVFARDPAISIGDTGGSAEFRAGGGQAQVYGAVVVEGGGAANANIDIIYNRRIMQRLGNRPSSSIAIVPGSWTDRYGY